MGNLLEQAKSLISLNRLIDSQNLLLSLLNSKDVTLIDREQCLCGLIEISKKLQKEEDIKKYNTFLAQVYFDQKKYRNFLDIYIQDLNEIKSNYLLKLIMISFLEEGEISNFKIVLNRLMSSLETNKLFHTAECLSDILEKSVTREEIDEYMLPFLWQKGDDKKIAEILDRAYKKYKSKNTILLWPINKNFLSGDNYYKNKVAPEAFYILYLENCLNREKETGILSSAQYLQMLKMFFDGHIFYPDSFEIVKIGLQIAIISNDKKLGNSILNVIDRNFKNLKKSQRDYVKSQKNEINKIKEDGFMLMKQQLSELPLSQQEKKIEIQEGSFVAQGNFDVNFVNSKQVKRIKRETIVPSGIFIDIVTSENYNDIFCLLHSLEEYEGCQKILDVALSSILEKKERSKKLQFRDKINIEYLMAENYISMGQYRHAIQLADQVICSMPLDLEDKITFWYLIAEAQFQLREYQSALSFFCLIRNFSENYRLVKIRISQIEQAE